MLSSGVFSQDAGATPALQAEAVRAICATEEPTVVIPVLGQLLHTTTGKWPAIRCLSTKWNDHRQAWALLEDYALIANDHFGIRMIAEAHAAHQRLIPTKVMSRLIEAPEAELRSIAIWYTEVAIRTLRVDRVLKMKQDAHTSNVQAVDRLASLLRALADGRPIEGDLPLPQKAELNNDF